MPQAAASALHSCTSQLRHVWPLPGVAPIATRATPRECASSRSTPPSSAAGGGACYPLSCLRSAVGENFRSTRAPNRQSPTMHSGARVGSTSSGSTGVGRRLRKLGALATTEAFSASVNGRLSLKAGEEPEESRLKPPGTPGAEKTYVTRVLRAIGCSRACCARPQVPADRRRVWRRVRGRLEGDQPAVRFARGGGREGCELDGLIEDDRVQSYDLVVGADGVRSAVRESLSLYGNTRTVRFEDKNERRYKTLPLHPSAVAGTASDLNWGCRNASIDLGMDALPTMEGEMVAVLLVKPDTPVYKTMQELSSGADARKFFEASLPRSSHTCAMTTSSASSLGDQPAALVLARRGRHPRVARPRRRRTPRRRDQGGEAVLRSGRQLGARGRHDPRRLSRGLRRRAGGGGGGIHGGARRRRARSCARRGASTAAARSAPPASSCLCSSTCSSTSSRRALHAADAARAAGRRNSFTGLRKRKRAERTLLIAIVAALVSAVRRVACV